MVRVRDVETGMNSRKGEEWWKLRLSNWPPQVSDFQLPGCIGLKSGMRPSCYRWWKRHWMVSDTLAETRRQQKSWLGMVLSCNRDGRLAATEHEAGIEWVSGHRLWSGRRYGSGHRLGIGYWQVTGSKSVINYGADATIKYNGKELKEYFDIINIDYYDVGLYRNVRIIDLNLSVGITNPRRLNLIFIPSVTVKHYIYCTSSP